MTEHSTMVESRNEALRIPIGNATFTPAGMVETTWIASCSCGWKGEAHDVIGDASEDAFDHLDEVANLTPSD